MQPSFVQEPALALLLGGGGARGAYQAGVLKGIAQRFPALRFPILTGISAGAVNTIHLASRDVPLSQAADELVTLWRSLTPDQVYDVRPLALARNVGRWGARLMSGGAVPGPEPARGMIDTAPLRRFLERSVERGPDGSLPGIARNVARGALRAVALSATSYATGRSVTWIEGRDIPHWDRPQRYSASTRLTVEHVMASGALPMLFPAVQVGGEWFGDGGIRLTAPLSPAIHLGATHVLTVSTRHRAGRRPTEAVAPRVYPPPAQVLGVLYRSVFLDHIDEDVLRLETINRLIADCPPGDPRGIRKIEIMVIRPSRDLGTLVRDAELHLPRVVRFLSRGLGTREATSPDVLSLLLFQQAYIQRLIELGEADVEAQAEAIEIFVTRSISAAA